MFIELILYIVGIVLFTILLFFISALITFKINANLDKFNLYECGFKSFDNTTRTVINIEFFLISVVFLIFDLETVVLLPWLINFKFVSYSSFWLVYSFIGLLILGYIYEIQLGLFNWNINLNTHTTPGKKN